MIGRECPNCKKKWYSAMTDNWICDNCKTELTNENNITEE